MQQKCRELDIQLKNGGQNTNFKLASYSSYQNGKTTFPREFFHKILVITGDCKYN